MSLALAALGRHDTSDAIQQLDLAARAYDPFLVYIADHPPFTQLWAEPRAQPLYLRLNLPVR
ncbi:MAG: hypothetical protein V9E93_00175 [Steroidobacteraceae bacterium]|nr:hypothetical protein [Pseudomonadota bacterium]MBP6105304.1 hypothetical protein [Steroidobacteraceae bacterium]MBP7012853.1 hypothetical protein [Steroidobacteraceae bacterium]